MNFMYPPKMPDASDSLNLLVSQMNQQIANMIAVDIPKIIMRNGTLEYRQSQTVREAISMRDSILNSMANKEITRRGTRSGASDGWTKEMV